MSAFVNKKNTYRIIITPEDCPALDQEEWVELMEGVSVKLMKSWEGKENLELAVEYLRASITGWSFMDEDKPVPITKDNIESLQLQILLKLWGDGQEHFPLVQTALPQETTESLLTVPSGEDS